MGQKQRLTKNQRRRLKKREQKRQAASSVNTADSATPPSSSSSSAAQDPHTLKEVSIEYVSAAEPDDDQSSAAYAQFAEVFAKFASAESLTTTEADKAAAEEAERRAEEEARARQQAALHSDSDSDGEVNATCISRRQQRIQSRLSVAELKQVVERPDVVEAHDVTSADPQLLVRLKAYRNTVEVPRHWCQKRKYLQGKRGVEKPAFVLPDFVEQTGIAKVRSAVEDDDSDKKLKSHQRARVTPKLGRIDIDYQVLHDAFFRFQTKPKMSHHGELYFEGKEYEHEARVQTPGILSVQLREALGMLSEGQAEAQAAGASTLVPPPWLINMQRYGPPPAYPSLPIPGLNAPIPAGAVYGYHAGGWGKPPVDEFGRPLYGDVFGAAQNAAAPQVGSGGTFAEDARWGAVEEELEEDLQEDADGGETGGADTRSAQVEHVGDDDAGAVADGMRSALPDEDTAADGVLQLRKDAAAASGKDADTPQPRQLYEVMETRDARVGGALMGSAHTYVLPGGGQRGVQVALDADELEGLDEDAIKLKYQEGVERNQQSKEDMSDLIAQEARKRKRKQDQASQRAAKQSKDFKF